MDIPAEWTFKRPEIAAAFDRHVREQLPWYDLATGIVAHVGRHFIPEGGLVVDIGASTGNIGRALARTLEARKAELIAVDNSADMAERYDAPGKLVVKDVREFDYLSVAPDLIVSFLCLMFVPVPHRRPLIARMIRSLRPGGAAIIFDKTPSLPGYLGTVMYRLALSAKYEAGAKPEEIIAKELSLAGSQRPLDPLEIPEFVEIFRFGDFAGFLYQRPAIEAPRGQTI
jgi:tRNA (cmo5U34)-methyltransferase